MDGPYGVKREDAFPKYPHYTSFSSMSGEIIC
jgi:hypothetical protein